MKLYTKTGDKGETGLIGGTRVPKSDLRIELYGEVDELNSFLGVAKESLDKEKFSQDRKIIEKVQSTLFDLGSNLACEEDKRDVFSLPQIDASLVTTLEERIDECEEKCPELKNFILPGGHIAATQFHVVRTVCRRVERHLVSSSVELPENTIVLMNRLSDYFFVLSRYVNIVYGENEILWIPNK